MHALAHANISDQYTDDNDTIMKFISETKECMQGEKNEEDAEELVDNIWSYIKEKWPECQRNENRSNQEDAGEYLNRLINESPYLKDKFTTNIANTITCENPDCDIMSNQYRQKRNINLATIKDFAKEMQLQELVDNIVKEGENTKCDSCDQVATIKNEITNAPDLLALLVPRVYENGEKIETDIRCPTRTVNIRNESTTTTYEVQCVIRHRGMQSQNGHYITNVYNNHKRQWMQMDDNKIIENNAVKEENKQGLIFIMRKIKTENNILNKGKSPVKKPLKKWNEPRFSTSRNENPYSYIRKHHPYPQSYERENPEQNQNHTNEVNPEDYYSIYKRQIPCKFYRNDNCDLGNECPYLHHICRHYQHGTCKFQDDCRYRHHRETPKKTNINRQD